MQVRPGTLFLIPDLAVVSHSVNGIQGIIDSLTKLAEVFGGGWLALTAVVVVCVSVVIIAVAPATISYQTARLRAYTRVRLAKITGRRRP